MQFHSKKKLKNNIDNETSVKTTVHSLFNGARLFSLINRCALLPLAHVTFLHYCIQIIGVPRNIGYRTFYHRCRVCRLQYIQTVVQLLFFTLLFVSFDQHVTFLLGCHSVIFLVCSKCECRQNNKRYKKKISSTEKYLQESNKNKYFHCFKSFVEKSEFYEWILCRNRDYP